MKVKFRTDEFVNTHGKEPRGEGNWAFSVMMTDCCGSFSTLYNCRFVYGTLTVAKRTIKQQAIEEARNTGRCRMILIDVLG